MLTAGYRSGIDNPAGLPAGLDEVIREAPGVGLRVASQAGPNGPDIVASVQAAVTDDFGRAMRAAAILGAVYVALRTPPADAETSALDASTRPPPAEQDPWAKPGTESRCTPASVQS